MLYVVLGFTVKDLNANVVLEFLGTSAGGYQQARNDAAINPGYQAVGCYALDGWGETTAPTPEELP
jgi:hypothetical protein